MSTIPDVSRAFIVYLYPHSENTLIEHGEIAIMPAIAIYLTTPEIPQNFVDHHCVVLKDCDPCNTVTEARNMAKSILDSEDSQHQIVKALTECLEVMVSS